MKKQKIVLITGCSSGIGKELSEFLASKNMIVYAGIRSNHDLINLKKTWENENNIIPLQIDVTDDKSCQKAISVIYKSEKKLDILINNAGKTLSSNSWEVKPSEYLDLLNINAVGAFRVIYNSLPIMFKQGYGQIINISSLNGEVVLPRFVHYSSSKFALDSLSKGLYLELIKKNIKVTTIRPGAVSKKSNLTKLNHKPLRERYWIIRVIFPITDVNKVVRAIYQIIRMDNPPTDLSIGNDAVIVGFLNKYLPNFIWKFMMIFL